MKTNKFLLRVWLLLSIFGCNNGENRLEKNNSHSGSAVSTIVSSSAAIENNKDTSRKFVRTALLKFKVKNVIKSTYNIEDIAIKHGGFVIYTNLTSNITDVTKIAISIDSTLETTNYIVTNSITLRVPNTKLDTILKEIASNIDYLDYRTIKAQNVALQMLSNNLTQKRSEKNAERLTITNSGKKLTETIIAEEVLLSNQEQSDNAKISNLSLKDQVNYSTISLSIYQGQAIKGELVFNEKNIDAYEASFGSKLLESVKFGWEILEGFIIFLTKLWELFLFSIVAFWLYKKYRHTFKN